MEEYSWWTDELAESLTYAGCMATVIALAVSFLSLLFRVSADDFALTLVAVLLLGRYLWKHQPSLADSESGEAVSELSPSMGEAVTA